MIPLFGYHMPSFSFPGLPPERLFDRVVELAQAAESAGFDLVTVMDHFYQIAIVARRREHAEFADDLARAGLAHDLLSACDGRLDHAQTARRHDQQRIDGVAG